MNTCIALIESINGTGASGEPPGHHRPCRSHIPATPHLCGIWTICKENRLSIQTDLNYSPTACGRERN
jgi:hypothetical protein